MRTLIVTPTYQEADNVEEFLRQCRAAVPDADILVVDDSSPDGTAAIAQWVGRELGQITLLQRPRKQGLGEAYRAGLEWGVNRDYDTLVQIDADLSHDPTVIPALRAAVADGAAMAIGSRYVPGGVIPHWPWFRRMLSRYGNRYAGFVLGLKVRDATAGYRARTARTRCTRSTSCTRVRRATASRSRSPTASGAPVARSSRSRSCSPTGCAATRR